MHLHHGCAGIDVNHEPRQVVALAVYQTVSIVGGISGYTDAAPHIVAMLSLRFEAGIDSLVPAEAEYTDGNAADLEIPLAMNSFLDV